MVSWTSWTGLHPGRTFLGRGRHHTGRRLFQGSWKGAWSVKCLTTPLMAAAWRSKPSWAIVATEDKSINPDTERQMYKRAGSVVTEIRGSHVVFASQPRAVAAVIEAAAKGSAAK
ncbi:MAG TPA: alpha/beta fold hydrolase [Puia sp.]|nr:alpha/beta fold hydrolase [Puia sp.]